MDARHYKDVITKYLYDTYYPYKTAAADPFLRYFLKHFKGIECIFMYGSMLNPEVSTPTSFPDFYIIVDKYSAFYKSYVHSLLNKIVPPNSYFLKINENGTTKPSKYCVIDKYGLMCATQHDKLKDLFIAGRLAKRIGILYVKDEKFLSFFLNRIYSAMRFNTLFALSDMVGERFSLDDFILRLLGLSYRAEVRTETDDKIVNLYNSEKAFYRKVYGIFLEQEIAGGNVEKNGDVYKTVRPCYPRNYIDTFIKRSRRRAVYRWPKSIYTFSDYVGYLELKIERTTGEKLNLTEWDRRLPLIFGWRYLFRLLKQKAIR